MASGSGLQTGAGTGVGGTLVAVGVGVSGWVTRHGVCLNADADRSLFRRIVPCGIADKPVTSLKRLLGQPPPMAQVTDDFERELKTFLNVRPG